MQARALREGEVLGVYMDFDRAADKSWPSAEYLVRFGEYVSQRTAEVNNEEPRKRDDGMPGDPDERYLRRLLASWVAIPCMYCDDGEAQGQQHGIVIDFMREPVADIDAKLRALNMARLRAWQDPQR